MSLFQEPARTPEEIEASAPLDIPPETVAEMDEEEWYARAYRQNAPQLTVRAVAIGTVLGFFLAFTNVYIGLKTGWFLGVNLTACILTFAISSVLPGKNRMSILESTCAVSTASSAGYATGFLAVTAAPAMLLLSVTQETPDGVKMRWPVMALWIFFLAALGVVLAIPMKRNMINTAKLKFPSGTAAAVTLQGLYSSGAGAMQRARALFTAAFVSALVPLLKELEIRKVGVDEKTGAVLRDTILPGQSNVFDWIPKILPESWTHRMLNAGPPKLHPEGKAFLFSDFQLKLDHGLALAFAGIIIGFRITFWMVIGGLITAFLVAPPALDALWTNALGNVVGAANKPQTAWKEIGVWCGAPLLVASGLVTFSAQWRTVGRAFTGMFGSPKKPETKPAEKKETKEDADWSADPFTKEKDAHALPKVNPEDIEVPNRWFATGIVVSGIGVITVAWLFFEIPPHLGLLAVAMTFVLAIVACRATGESDITPGGPFGKIMQLTYGILIPQSSTANLQTAAITASASLSSADLLNDLKCGYLLGANPRRQFVAQAAGILTGTIATTLCYFVLVPSASVMIGTDTKPPTFPAPGAQQWKAVAEVFKYGLGNLHPMAQAGIKWGVVAGVVLAVIEIFAPKKWKKWVPSPTGIGLGMVLPFFIPLSMFLGALFGTIATAVNKTWSERYILAIAAGGIAGESIIGVLVQGLNNFVLH